MSEDTIVAQNISKIYPFYRSYREKYMDFFLPGTYGGRFYALRDINFVAHKGQSVALLGMNGSGKSTLANIIAGISSTSSGNLVVDGEVSMTAVSGGLNLFLTGEENIIQKCLLLGFTHSEIKEMMPQIIEFSELAGFIKQPAKTYSSGMRAKLSFSISVNIDPDIMVIDEALSVGDSTFTAKCLNKMNEFREKGTTIVFVSHSLPQVRDFCDQAMWLEGGKIKMLGDCNDVADEYQAFTTYFNKLSQAEQKKLKEKIQRERMLEGTGGR